MATDLETSIRNAAHKLAKALEDASELKVETRYVEVTDPQADIPKDEKGWLLARTVIALDGDTDVVIPMTRSDTGALERDEDLLALHLTNVSSAIEYRANLLDSLLGMLREARSR